MSRVQLTAMLLTGWIAGACSHTASDPTKNIDRERQTSAARSAPQPVTVIPVTPASEVVPSTFSEKLRFISQRFGSDLTPARVASVLGGSAQSTSARRWSVKLEHESQVDIEAEAVDAPVRWLEVSLSREFGFTFAELLVIFGEGYDKVENTKHGTNIFFNAPRAGSVTPGVSVAARLWSRTAVPNAEVVKIHLLKGTAE